METIRIFVAFLDENKKDDFLNKLTEKFEFIGEQDYNSMENEKIVYTVGTYVNIPEERKTPARTNKGTERESVFGFVCY